MHFCDIWRWYSHVLVAQSRCRTALLPSELVWATPLQLPTSIPGNRQMQDMIVFSFLEYHYQWPNNIVFRFCPPLLVQCVGKSSTWGRPQFFTYYCCHSPFYKRTSLFIVLLIEEHLDCLIFGALNEVIINVCLEIFMRTLYSLNRNCHPKAHIFEHLM